MDRPLEPGLLRIFRYFTGIAMIYFALVMVYAMLVAGQGLVLQAQSSVNFATNLALFGYLSWPWLARRLRRWYLPVGLVAATIIPVASNLLYLAAPEESLYFVIARSWLVLPILVVPLVITAWQYRFRNVVGFIIFTTGVELLALIPEVEVIDTDTLLLLGVPAVRAFAFGTVGHIVSRLTATQREQREALMTANVQLAQHAQTLAQLAASRERNRLARELHDTLAHTLSGLAVNLEALKTVMPPGADEANHMLDDSLAITRTGLGETRRALRALRAQPLEDLGLSLALRHQALSITTRANLALDLELTPDIEGLSPEAEQNLYRIVQEGLENIARHADARRVALRLVRAESGLVLTLEDDGRGFEPADSPAELSYGLRGMRERAEEIGARLTVESRPGAGTVVTVTLQEVGR